MLAAPTHARHRTGFLRTDLRIPEVHLPATNYGPLSLRPSAATNIRTSPPPTHARHRTDLLRTDDRIPEVHLIATNNGPPSLSLSIPDNILTMRPPQRWQLSPRVARLMEMTVEGGENSTFDPDSIIDLQTHQMLAERAQHWRNAAQALRERHPPTER